MISLSCSSRHSSNRLSAKTPCSRHKTKGSLQLSIPLRCLRRARQCSRPHRRALAWLVGQSETLSAPSATSCSNAGRLSRLNCRSASSVQRHRICPAKPRRSSCRRSLPPSSTLAAHNAPHRSLASGPSSPAVWALRSVLQMAPSRHQTLFQVLARSRIACRRSIAIDCLHSSSSGYHACPSARPVVQREPQLRHPPQAPVHRRRTHHNSLEAHHSRCRIRDSLPARSRTHSSRHSLHSNNNNRSSSSNNNNNNSSSSPNSNSYISRELRMPTARGSLVPTDPTARRQ